mgnify:CR=1 FL=1
MTVVCSVLLLDLFVLARGEERVFRFLPNGTRGQHPQRIEGVTREQVPRLIRRRRINRRRRGRHAEPAQTSERVHPREWVDVLLLLPSSRLGPRRASSPRVRSRSRGFGVRVYKVTDGPATDRGGTERIALVMRRALVLLEPRLVHLSVVHGVPRRRIRVRSAGEKIDGAGEQVVAARGVGVGGVE